MAEELPLYLGLSPLNPPVTREMIVNCFKNVYLVADIRSVESAFRGSIQSNGEITSHPNAMFLRTPPQLTPLSKSQWCLICLVTLQMNLVPLTLM